MFLQKIALFTALMVVTSMLFADPEPTGKKRAWFAKLATSTNMIVATFPNEGVRYHLWLNEIDKGVSSYGQSVELNYGDTLKMQDKHQLCSLQAKKSSDFIGLVGTCEGNFRGKNVYRYVALPVDGGEQNLPSQSRPME